MNISKIKYKQFSIPALLRFAGLFLTLFLVSSQSSGVFASSVWQELIDRLAADGVSRTTLDTAFNRGDLFFDPKVLAGKVNAMIRSKFHPVKVTPKTLETSAYKQFFTPDMIAKALDFMQTNQELFDRSEVEFGVPREVQVALLMVETKLGTYLGEQKAFDMLASMALGRNFELIKPYVQTGKSKAKMSFAIKAASSRSEWAYKELKALLRYAEKVQAELGSIPGSIYGAIGLCQFMPSNIPHYGRDGNGDGIIDLFVLEDAVYSMSNYLRAHGWTPGIAGAARDKVIYSYNHSRLYVLAVRTLAETISSAALAAASEAELPGQPRISTQ